MIKRLILSVHGDEEIQYVILTLDRDTVRRLRTIAAERLTFSKDIAAVEYFDPTDAQWYQLEAVTGPDYTEDEPAETPELRDEEWRPLAEHETGMDVERLVVVGGGTMWFSAYAGDDRLETDPISHDNLNEWCRMFGVEPLPDVVRSET